MRKRPLSIPLVVAASLLPAAWLSGCTPGAPAKAGKIDVRAALVLDTGGVDDKSFNANAWAGMQRAIQGGGVEGKYVESRTPSDYETNLTQFAAQGYDIIFAVGYKMQDAVKAVAPQFPDIKFVLVDGAAPNLPNCASLLFREEQGSYLAGFLAASMTKTHKIGFVGGEQIPLIRKFEAGYDAGARTADPTVQVVSAYTGDWDDLLKGKSQAEQEFANGADIIYHAAGKAGLGVIEAAREKGPGYYAIGVDADQDDVAPGRVLTSMMKRLDIAVYDEIEQARKKRFAPGNHIFGLREGGVSLSPMKYTKQDIPPQVLQRLKTLQEMIIEGKVTPPATMAELAAFKPPKV
ncbi:MAG TPA: BMP family ABC transporter substrate-binding protein [Chthonomonadales bacterium]|nr:BMP family ABC transporter substrate-binding protein [Chthonomonadales bacterium]